jgi:hypothetical protein
MATPETQQTTNSVTGAADRRSAPCGCSVSATAKSLGDLLRKYAVIDAAALVDPEGYDGGLTQLRIRLVAEELHSYYSPNDVSQRRVPAPDDRKQNTAATGTSLLH